jgi:5-methylthioribose kinase
MREIDATTAESYLRETGRIAPDAPVSIRELAGGVSNVVLLVSRPNGESLFVVKQARGQLRVADPWFCSVARIFREVDVLEICRRVLELCCGAHNEAALSIDVPCVLFVDRENYLFAMTAAPAHQVWKQQLLEGRCDPAVAAASGRMLGILHANTWNHSGVARQLADQTYFDQLRLDPYYRHVGRQHAELAPSLERLIKSLADHPRCLVHGDFSPKNILVGSGGLTLVDCEVGHFGDPAFDLGFFLSHLILKAFHARPRGWDYIRLTFDFWQAYESQLLPVAGRNEYEQLVARGIGNCAGCCLARVAGKSTVEYLASDRRDAVSRWATASIGRTPPTWPELVAVLLHKLG